ncbi:MAG: L,D-transpeptidase [Bacteroidota bacterium]|nr:L,D-transpeptidase [Bacteroidota bacterium]
MRDIQTIHREYARRKRRQAVASVLSAAWFIALAWATNGTLQEVNWHRWTESRDDGTLPRNASSTFISSIGRMLDTVYTPASAIIEVRLDSQYLLVHRRTGAQTRYPISSGTPALRRGMETRQGIFLVQNKFDWLISTQFNNTKVFNWLGFNWGIGFHSLAGRGYYRSLGKAPSSHGCVRLAEEHARALYAEIERGTPVFVHKGSPARIVAFADDTTVTETPMTPVEASAVFAQRLADVYDGTRLFRRHVDIPLTRTVIGHNGLPIGDGKSLPPRQMIPPAYIVLPRSPRLFTAVVEPSPRRWKAIVHDTLREPVERTILP